MTKPSLPLALTQGDPAGIGPDIALMAWLGRERHDIAPFLYIGDAVVLKVRAKMLGLAVDIELCDPAHAAAIFNKALPVLAIPIDGDVVAGRPDSAFAPAIIDAIEKAVQLTLAGEASAVVTNPIAKSVLYRAGFKFAGHTEFLAELAGVATGVKLTPVMMLAGPKLKTVPVTIHIPLKDVAATLSSDLIEQTCRITAHDLKSRFGMASPRLAIAGLNPHAGENGTIGLEDDAIIRPAIERMQADGLDVTGPLPADTMFHEEARQLYDVAICMYHDQALIPAKALGFDDSVNVTLGLPFIRTSPDHGTAFSLAGTGKAKPLSLMAALNLAATMSAYESSNNECL